MGGGSVACSMALRRLQRVKRMLRVGTTRLSGEKGITKTGGEVTEQADVACLFCCLASRLMRQAD